jgi:hypothetical protein
MFSSRNLSSKRRGLVRLLNDHLTRIIFQIINGQKAFITGRTSVFLPDKPLETVLLPTYNLRDHYIGHESKVNLVHNEALNCHIVFDNAPKICTHYLTHILRTRDDVIGIVSSF